MIDGLRAKLTQVDVASQKTAKAAAAGTSAASSGPLDQLFAESSTVEVSSARYSGQKPTLRLTAQRLTGFVMRSATILIRSTSRNWLTG